ncbi:MAG: sodium:solute symporter family protein [candidate division Zixibacteria bacterium]|nr:sodium:solute symporter family protein [candidate division Zixibacteria bacterium]
MFGTLDAVLLIIYLILLSGIGARQFFKRKQDIDEYLVMGRRLALPGFVASLVSSWYGGILGVGEYSYTYGLSNWIVFGLPYYLGAIIFALFLAKKARQSQVLTIPDQLEKIYDRKTSLAGAFLVFITTVPAAYVLQVGFLAQSVFEIPLILGIIGGAVFSIFYVITGGLRNDVMTDRIQFVLMFIGFIVMTFFLFTNYGGLEFIRENVPEENLTWNGGLPFTYILVWYFIALATLVEPAFYQRCFAAKSDSTAQKGIFVALIFWAFFDFMTTSTGLYARAIIPDLVDPATSYVMLSAKVLPDAFRAIFLLGLFATIMSTVDSFTLISGQTLGRDFIHKLWGGDETRLTQIGMVVAGAVAVSIAIFKRSIVDIWYDFGSVSTAALLLPLASSFSVRWRMRSNCAFANIIICGLVVIIWIVLGYCYEKPFLGIDPIYPGLSVSILIFTLNMTAFKKCITK